MDVEIETVTVVNEEVLAAFERLLPQLSQSAPPLDAEALGRIVAWHGSRLLVARWDRIIVGTLTLVMFPIPTGLRAWVEDVVVDESARGRGPHPRGDPPGLGDRRDDCGPHLARLSAGGEPVVRADGFPAP